MALEWLAPVAGLVGVVIGGSISYLVQNKNQKRAWQREYAVKTAETVYGPLYNDVTNIISSFESLPIAFQCITFGKWQEFQADHRHLMVNDENFRNKLDNFLVRAKSFNKDIVHLNSQIIPVIIQEEFKKKFNVVCPNPTLHFYLKRHESCRFEIYVSAVDCVIKNSYPQVAIHWDYPEAEVVSCEFVDRDKIEIDIDEAKFNSFICRCFLRMHDDGTTNSLLQERGSLLEEAYNLKRDLKKRIESPWAI